MEYKEVQEIKIPSLGLGTWKMGGSLIADRSHDREYIEAIKRAIKLGITHIDTAELYGNGHTEELVGRAIAHFERKRLFITTKVSAHHLSFKAILQACGHSLERLKTNFIDLYLIHWPNPLVSMKNAMAAFDQLKAEGKIRLIGVSNFSPRQFQNAQKYTRNKIITNQVHYNLLNRHPEKDLLEFCQRENVLVTAYSPLAQGQLVSGRFQALDQVAKKYQKTPSQVAIRWLLDKPNVITIPKMTTKSHLEEILGSLGWHLAKEDQLYLEKSPEFAI